MKTTSFKNLLQDNSLVLASTKWEKKTNGFIQILSIRSFAAFTIIYYGQFSMD